jgi:hypothetical protein
VRSELRVRFHRAIVPGRPRSCAGIGGLITTRIPGNAIGWLLELIGLLLAVSLFAEQYALRSLAAAPGSLPAVRQVGALSGGTAVLALIQVVFLVLLFPDGRLPVLRYRLYDLDVVVRRTVVAGLVAAAFTAIYAVVVVAVGAATGWSGSSGLTFAAAALAAVALQPVRARAGLVADRLVSGRRATPYEVLSEFAGRIAGTFSTEDVLPSMARMLVEATGAERAEVWLRSGGIERMEAAR